jgi:hypothetical protein
MSNPTETAARAYVAAWQEPDPAARARLLEACWSADARVVSRGAGIDGRAALAKAIDDFFADPRGLSARLVTAIDVQGPIFRFHAVVTDRDGRTVFEGEDAALVGADGRITILLTFGGPALAPPSAPR